MLTVWNKRAENDLYLIIGYIYKQSPQNAQKVLNEVQSLVSTLQIFPYKYPKEPNYNSDTVRYAVIYSYKIVYRVQKEKIRILRVFHTKQNPKSI